MVIWNVSSVHNKIDLKYLQQIEHNKKGNLTIHFSPIILISNDKSNLFLLIHHEIMYMNQMNRMEFMRTNAPATLPGANFSNSIYFSFEWWIYLLNRNSISLCDINVNTKIPFKLLVHSVFRLLCDWNNRENNLSRHIKIEYDDIITFRFNVRNDCRTGLKRNCSVLCSFNI